VLAIVIAFVFGVSPALPVTRGGCIVCTRLQHATSNKQQATQHCQRSVQYRATSVRLFTTVKPRRPKAASSGVGAEQKMQSCSESLPRLHESLRGTRLQRAEMMIEASRTLHELALALALALSRMIRRRTYVLPTQSLHGRIFAPSTTPRCAALARPRHRPHLS